MKTYHLALCILFLCLSCRPEVNQENLALIQSSDTYTVQIIASRGNISGSPSRSLTEEKFIVSKWDQGQTVEYHAPSFHSDSMFVFQLAEQEVDSLLLLINAAVESHDPRKEYDGCCMCRNVDFSIYNEDLKMEVRPSEEVEYVYGELTHKYDDLLYQKSQEYLKSW